MGAFQAIAYSVLASIIFCIGYISFRTARFPAVQMITGGRKWLAVLLCAVIFLLGFGSAAKLTDHYLNNTPNYTDE